MLLDWPYSARAYIRFGFVRADGEAVLTLDGTDWKASGNFGGTSAKEWRFSEIAKSNGTTLEAVQRRYAGKMREKIPSGTWYQDDAGKWLQKK